VILHLEQRLSLVSTGRLALRLWHLLQEEGDGLFVLGEKRPRIEVSAGRRVNGECCLERNELVAYGQRDRLCLRLKGSAKLLIRTQEKPCCRVVMNKDQQVLWFRLGEKVGKGE
jgi:hypothetical protein